MPVKKRYRIPRARQIGVERGIRKAAISAFHDYQVAGLRLQLVHDREVPGALRQQRAVQFRSAGHEAKRQLLMPIGRRGTAAVAQIRLESHLQVNHGHARTPRCIQNSGGGSNDFRRTRNIHARDVQHALFAGERVLHIYHQHGGLCEVDFYRLGLGN